MDVSFFQQLLTKISDRGRQFLDLSFISTEEPKSLLSLCHTLMSSTGEASGVALARQILAQYFEADDDEKSTFFAFLARDFQADHEKVQQAAQAYLSAPNPKTLDSLAKIVEPPRQELLRRLNLAPGGTAALVQMRQDLLAAIKSQESLASVDYDFRHLFSSWFNRGFLVLARISWSSPASILEKIIDYEAVHEIKGWDDLRRRLEPHDRRCFAFFHPALVDEPLIFVEVALDNEMPTSIHTLLEADARPAEMIAEPTVAIFYSISNCQEGLRGISFGNFLIKQVVEDLAGEIPTLRTFVTLSPAPGFRDWLIKAFKQGDLNYLGEKQKATLNNILEEGWPHDEDVQDELKPVMLALASHYFLRAKDRHGKPVDPVARFHLGNGARLERLNWLGDTSEKGIQQSFSLMVNYRYELKDIERNHEAYVNQGIVAAAKSVRSALLTPEKSKALVPAEG